MEEFNVSSTVAILPLTLYVVALGFGPVVGGPLSETWGRHPVYLGSVPLGGVFALGAGFTNNFGALCFLRFMSGFCWAPVLATAAGSLSDIFPPRTRGPASAVFILMPFLGPGFGYERSEHLPMLLSFSLIIPSLAQSLVPSLCRERVGDGLNGHNSFSPSSASPSH